MLSFPLVDMASCLILGLETGRGMLEQLKKAMSENQRLEVTVWDPKNDRVEHNFHSYIVSLDLPRFLVAPPGPKEEKRVAPLMEAGVLVGIVLDSNPAPYIFYPTVHSRVYSPNPGFWLKLLPDTRVEIVQRRRHVRIPMQIPFKIEHLIGANHWTLVDAVTEDVSGGGMRFTASKQFFKEQEVRLKIQFGIDQPVLKIKGRVVFCKENRLRRRKDDYYVAACEFHDIDPHVETVIVRECFRRELGLKK